MAAIERKCVLAGLLLALLLPAALRADRAADVRAQISYVATALTSGNAADAMAPFDKSFASYDKLSNYFQGLNAFQVDNEVEVVDELDSDADTKLLLRWTLTLVDLGTDASERRTADINVRLVLKDGKWRIVDFSPIAIFNPQRNSSPKR